MACVSAQNRVLYFDPGRDPQRSAFSELIGNAPNFLLLRMQQVRDNITVVSTPSSLPHIRRHLPRPVLQLTMPFVVRANAQILIWHIRRVQKALGISSPVLWLYSPYHVDLIGKFNEKLACYYNYDEFPEYVSNQRIKDIIRNFDAQLCRQVDAVFTTSQAQCQVRKAYNPQTYFVPNGVDFELFHRALLPGGDLPPDIARISHPIIGYAGRLGSQIDVPLLRRVAEAHPGSSLVLVGPDELPPSMDEKALRALPNVYFLGCKKPSELPAYLAAFDAALIPYPLIGHVLSGYPTKLHEYLAAGRAIVATAMPELCAYQHVLRIGRTHAEFVALIGEAVQDHSPKAIEARVSVARENTWESRVAEIYRVLGPMLCGK
jgi:glycosyltransferase involved in cell wall biosynthesis